MVQVDELETMHARLKTELDQVEVEFREVRERREALRSAIMGIDRLLRLSGSENQTIELHGMESTVKFGTPNVLNVADSDSFALDDEAEVVKVPRGKEAVWQVFRDNPGKEFTVPLLLAALEEMDAAPDSADKEGTLRVTLRRASIDHPEIERVGYGKYAYKPTRSPQVVEATKGSG